MFDHALAHATADACEAAAGRLAGARRGQVADTASAAEGWLGPHRDRFDHDLARAVRRSEQVEVALRRLADELRAASMAADRQGTPRWT
jgi:hypothetical protein